MSRNTGQIPRGASSLGVNICNRDVMGIVAFPVYVSSEGDSVSFSSDSSMSFFLWVSEGALLFESTQADFGKGVDFCVSLFGCIELFLFHSSVSSCSSSNGRAEERKRPEDARSRDGLFCRISNRILLWQALRRRICRYHIIVANGILVWDDQGFQKVLVRRKEWM